MVYVYSIVRLVKMMRRRLGASYCFLVLDSCYSLVFDVGSSGDDGGEEAIIFDNAVITIVGGYCLRCTYNIANYVVYEYLLWLWIWNLAAEVPGAAAFFCFLSLMYTLMDMLIDKAGSNILLYKRGGVGWTYGYC